MFVTFEGGEGGGKSSQMGRTKAFLVENGFDVLLSHEPGGVPISEEIRWILKDSFHRKTMSSKTDLLLFTAARVQHLEQKVLPAVADGEIVISDRYFDSSWVYQCFVGGVDHALFARLNQLFEISKPDLTFLLDLPAEVGLSRTRCQFQNGCRDPGQGRFEAETLTYHEKVREGYLVLSKIANDRFCVIDAEQSEEDVWEDIKQVLINEVLSRKE